MRHAPYAPLKLITKWPGHFNKSGDGINFSKQRTDHCPFIRQYLFLLTLLLLGELAVGALAALGPQFLGLAIESPRLTDALQRGYGVPGREQFTAALDLAQVSVREH